MKKILSKVKTFAITFDKEYILVVLALLAGLFVVCGFTGKWPTQDNPYNSYALQAQSWLEGRLDLGMDYSYLELAIFDGKYFVSFPPFVSYILVPFVMLKGGQPNTPDNMIAIVVFIIGGIYAVKLYKLLRKKEKGAVLFTLLLFLASNALFCGFNGWVWFIAQNFAFTLSLMSIYYAEKGSLGLSLTFLACAVGCRPFQFVYIPVIFFIYLTQWKKLYVEEERTVKMFIKTNWYKCLFPLIIGQLSAALLRAMGGDQRGDQHDDDQARNFRKRDMNDTLEAVRAVHDGRLVKRRVHAGYGSQVEDGPPASFLPYIRDHEERPEVA